MKRILFGCLLLAWVAAAFYFLMGSGRITVPTPDTVEAPAGIVYIACGCYVLGGLLILVRKRWLWMTGLVMNTLVLVIFFMMYRGKPDILLSLPGLGTKIAQVFLEIGLIILIARYKKKTSSKSRKAKKA
jgi:hypothetical protein